MFFWSKQLRTFPGLCPNFVWSLGINPFETRNFILFFLQECHLCVSVMPLGRFVALLLLCFTGRKTVFNHFIIVIIFIQTSLCSFMSNFQSGKLSLFFCVNLFQQKARKKYHSKTKMCSLQLADNAAFSSEVATAVLDADVLDICCSCDQSTSCLHFRCSCAGWAGSLIKAWLQSLPLGDCGSERSLVIISLTFVIRDTWNPLRGHTHTHPAVVWLTSCFGVC